MLAYSAAEMTSQEIRTARGGSRSIQAPAGRPMSSQGSQAAATSVLTVSVLACSTVTAISGITTTAIALPSWLIVSPNQSRRKLLCQSNPPGRVLTSPACAPPAACGITFRARRIQRAAQDAERASGSSPRPTMGHDKPPGAS